MPLDEAVLFGIAAMVLHEMGHVAVAHALRVKVHQIGISRKGLYTRRAMGTSAQNFVITLAGPGTNLCLAVLFHRSFPHFALCNLIMGVVNLLPIPASDGARAIKLVWKLFGPSEIPAAKAIPVVSGAEMK